MYPKIRLRLSYLRFALLLSSLGLISAQAQTSEAPCDHARERWAQVSKVAPTAQAPLASWNQWHRQKGELLECIAQQLFDAFLNQGQTIQYLSWVRDGQDQRVLEQALQLEAYRQTLRHLSRSPEGQKWVEQVQKKAASSGLGFSLTTSSEALQERPAGYVRAQGHIVMNYAVMTRDDWLFLFIHEFSHYIDPKLDQAVQSAIELSEQNPKLIAKILEWVAPVKSLSELSTEQNQKIDQFLRLALERGWLAEVRAWTQTLELYEALRAQGWIQQVAWADEMIQSKRRQMGVRADSWKAYLIEYLKPRFQYPKNGVYSNSLLRARSDQIEAELFEKALR